MRSLLVSLLAVSGLLAAGLSIMHTASAESRGYTPPLATEARSAPARFPEDVAVDRLAAMRARRALLLGMARYDVLNREAADLMQDHAHRRLDGDAFIAQMESFAPLSGGAADIPLLQAWTVASPDSYAAWFALGRQYLELAVASWDGGVSGGKVRDGAAVRYAEQADVALERSLALYARPLASLSALIRVQAYGGPFVFDFGGRSIAAECTQGRTPQAREGRHRSCAATWREVQYHALRVASEAAPDVLDFYAAYFAYNGPHWGSRYAHLRELVTDTRLHGRTDKGHLAAIHALELATEAADAPDAMRAADLFIQAFDANAVPENLSRLYAAADAAKRAHNTPFAIKIYDRIVQIRPGEYRALLLRAEGVEAEYRDHSRFFADVSEAARLGMKEAQAHIGYAYLTGVNGFPVDLQEARNWLALAASQGDHLSRERLTALEELLTEGQGAVDHIH